MRSRGWQYARFCIGLVVGGVVLWLASRGLGWEDFWQVLKRARWPWVVLSWLTVLVGTAVKAWRWKLLLGRNGQGANWLGVLAMLSVDRLVNAALPGRFGELVRAHLAKRESISPFTVALGTILVEKVLDGLAVLSFAGILALTIVLPEWFRSATSSFAGVLILLAILVAGIILRQGWLTRACQRLPERWRAPIEGGLRGVATFRQEGTLFPSVALTAVTWILGAATNYLLFVALGLPISVSAALLILVTIHLGSLVPVVPGQLGLFHYLTILSLSVFGVTRRTSMPYATVLYILVYSTIVGLGLGGLGWLSVDWHTLISQLRAVPRRVGKPQ